jgi:hypothetical protein
LTAEGVADAKAYHEYADGGFDDDGQLGDAAPSGYSELTVPELESSRALRGTI